jgi:hypothetical protein
MRWPSRYLLRTKRSAKVLHRFGGLSFKICLAAQVMPIFIFAIDRAHPFDCCMCAHVQHFCYLFHLLFRLLYRLLHRLFTCYYSIHIAAGSTISWSPSELEYLQDNELAHSTRALLSKIQKVFKSQIQPLQQQFRPQLDAIDFTRFLWAWSCVGSRTFGRFLPYPSLVPFADMLNHVNVHTTYRWDGTHAVYFNDSRSPAVVGSELCFSWVHFDPRSHARWR